MSTSLQPPQSFVDAIWTNGIEPEMIEFIDNLNWFYIIMFINILYGLKYTGQFNWYDKLLTESKLKPYKIWIMAFVLSFIHIGFRWADPTLDISVSYISSLTRSLIVAVIFSGVFVDIPALLIEKFKDFLEPKNKVDDEEKK